jgi:hypothetical protein
VILSISSGISPSFFSVVFQVISLQLAILAFYAKGGEDFTKIISKLKTERRAKRGEIKKNARLKT